MARHRGTVLVDTNVILEAHRSGSWRALTGGYGVETVEDCVNETQTGFQRRRPERRIDEARLRDRLAGVHAVGDQLGLTRASSVCAACDPGLAEAEDRLRRYAAMFCRTYGDGETLVPFSCESNGVAAPSSEVMGAVLEGRGGALLHGPSGCGKTMLASSSGVALTGRGGVAISVQGKDFVGGVKELMDREAGLLGARSGMQLINDARRLGRPILFIVDGYNECSQDRQRLLTRVVAALAYRYEAGTLVTSQVPLARGSLLELQKFEVRAPSTETKVAIAMQAGDGRGPSEAIEFLLGAVSTGLEARLVGEVGATVAPGSSRYALFDAYARKRLGEAASDGIRVLSQVSAWLFERFAFSLSLRDFDRLMDGSGVSTELRRLVIDRDLLTLRGDRVSFPHEMFLDAFAAEAVIRGAGGSPGPVLKALAAPLHAERKDLLIGAIDDDSMLERLLPRLPPRRAPPMDWTSLSRLAASPNVNWSQRPLSIASRTMIPAAVSKAITTKACAPSLVDSRSSARKLVWPRSTATALIAPSQAASNVRARPRPQASSM